MLCKHCNLTLEPDPIVGWRHLLSHSIILYRCLECRKIHGNPRRCPACASPNGIVDHSALPTHKG